MLNAPNWRTFRFKMVRGVSVMAEAQDERMTLRLEAVTDTP